VGVIVVCFAGRAANLREREVDTEGGVLVVEIGFELVDDLLMCQCRSWMMRRG
jgi:hypothetical protein